MNKNRNLDYIDPNSSPATGTLRCVVGRKYGAAKGGPLYQIFLEFDNKVTVDIFSLV